MIGLYSFVGSFTLCFRFRQIITLGSPVEPCFTQISYDHGRLWAHSALQLCSMKCLKCWYNRLLFPYFEHVAALQGPARAAMAVPPPWAMVLLRPGPPGPMPTLIPTLGTGGPAGVARRAARLELLELLDHEDAELNLVLWQKMLNAQEEERRSRQRAALAACISHGGRAARRHGRNPLTVLGMNLTPERHASTATEPALVLHKYLRKNEKVRGLLPQAAARATGAGRCSPELHAGEGAGGMPNSG